MIHVLARITARPDSAHAVRKVLLELVAETRSKEPSCLAYALYQRADEPALFQTVEQWRDDASADAHMIKPHVGAAIAQVGALLAAPPEILRFEKIA